MKCPKCNSTNIETFFDEEPIGDDEWDWFEYGFCNDCKYSAPITEFEGG